MQNKLYTTLFLLAFSTFTSTKVDSTSAKSSLKATIKSMGKHHQVLLVTLNASLLQYIQRSLISLVPKDELNQSSQILQESQKLYESFAKDGTNPTEKQQAEIRDLESKLYKVMDELSAKYPELTRYDVCIRNALNSVAEELDSTVFALPENCFVGYPCKDNEKIKRITQETQELFEAHCRKFVDDKTIEMKQK